MPRSGAGPSIGLPHIRRLPRVAFSKPATMRSSVDLPQPDAPIRQTNSPLLDAQMRVAQRVDAVAVELELLGHAFQFEDRTG